ncbi:MAG: hypothetical protein H7233_05330 [Pseudorhodobacter sp.]|nr:hypothetical protein [Frankiaceae bacterium]
MQPPLTETTARVVGALSTVALAVVAVVGWRSRAVLVPAVVLGVVVAAAGRFVTAGVIGVNIGGALTVLLCPVVVLPLCVWLAVTWRGLDRARRGPLHPRTDPLGGVRRVRRGLTSPGLAKVTDR